MKIKIAKRKKKAGPKAKSKISIKIPKHVEWRGGQTGELVNDEDNFVVKFRDGGTTGFPPELFDEVRPTPSQKTLPFG